jgi:hypothetical protein
MLNILFVLRTVVAPPLILATCYLYPAHTKLSRSVPSSSVSKQEKARLAITPAEVERRDVVYLLLLFLWRFALQTAGLRKPLRPRQTRRDGEEEYVLDGPVNQVEMPLQVSLTPAIAVYNKAIGSGGSYLDKLQYPLFFCAVTTPALLLILAEKTCPVQPLGTVNVRNVFKVLNMAACQKLVDGTGDYAPAVISARLDQKARKVKRGWEMDFVIDIVSIHNELGKRGTIFTQTFTFLQFYRHHVPPAHPSADRLTGASEGSTLAAAMSLASDDTLAWAKVTKDYNPIHISYYAARLFGQAGRIAHGNHICAKALEELDKVSDRKLSGATVLGETLEMQVAFRRPVGVPSKLKAVCRQEGGHAYIAIKYAAKDCIEITVG